MTAGESTFDVDEIMKGLRGAAALRAAMVTVINVREAAAARVRDLEWLELEVRDRGDVERGDAFAGMRWRKSQEVDRLGQELVVLGQRLVNVEGFTAGGPAEGDLAANQERSDAMWSFKNLVKGKKSAANWQSMIDEATAAKKDADAAIVDLNARRGAAVVDGDKAALDALDAELRAHRRDSNDLASALPELKLQFAKAEQEAKDAAGDSLKALGDKLSDHGVDLIDVIGKHAAPIAEAVAALDAVTARIRTINAELAAAGDPRRVDQPNRVALVGEAVEAATQYSDLSKTIVLPRTMPHPARNYWPPEGVEAANAARKLGEERLQAFIG